MTFMSKKKRLKSFILYFNFKWFVSTKIDCFNQINDL